MRINSDCFSNIHSRFGESISYIITLLPQEIIDAADKKIIGGWRVWATGMEFLDHKDWERGILWLTSALDLLESQVVEKESIFGAEVIKAVGTILFEEGKIRASGLYFTKGNYNCI
jgi:hypothetical protein